MSTKIITAVANAKLSTAEKKFGNSSVYFDGSSYLTTPSDDDYGFGTSDFTIDAWINISTISTRYAILGQPNDSNNNWLVFEVLNNRLSFGVGVSNSGVVSISTAELSWSTGTWYHVAVVKNGSAFILYRDGVPLTIDTSYCYTAYTGASIPANGNTLRIGSFNSNRYFSGYIDELRISKGIARWTSAFTPPTSEYETDSNTVLLLHFNGINNSTTIVDDSMQSYMTITDAKAYGGDAATSLTGTITANAGDIVVATITARSEVTLPEGWTLLYDSGVFAGNGQNQRLILAYKAADVDGTISMTVTQSTSARLYLNLTSCGNVVSVSFWSGSVATATGTATITAPDKVAGKAVIWGASCPSWGSGDWITSPSDLIFLGNGTEPRNGTFIDRGGGTASGRTFVSNGTTYNICAALIFQQSEYKQHGTAIYQTTVAGEIKTSTITWTENKPTGTSVAVSVSTDGTTYTPVTNGGSFLPNAGYNNQTVYIKVELTTTDTSVTPTVSGLTYTVVTNEDSYKIILEMEPLQRFESAAGDITVAYSGGTLAGVGGVVAPFSRKFTPNGLVYKGDQNDAEHIELSATAVGILIHIYYTDTVPQDQGHVELSSVTATGVLTNVNDI